MIIDNAIIDFTKERKSSKVRIVSFSIDNKLLQSLLNAKESKNKNVLLRRRHAARVVNEIIVPHIIANNGKRLDLSDKIISQKFHCSFKEGSYIRRVLLDSGVIYIPADGKQSKKGDYPIFKLNRDLMLEVIIEVPEKIKRKRPYVPEFYSKYENVACWDIISHYKDEGIKIPEWAFFSEVKDLVDYRLKKDGLTREYFRV